MIIVVVNFKIPPDLNYNSIKSKFEETAPMYLDCKGLTKKNYIIDIENKVAGGIYYFDNIVNARNWFNEERLEYLSNRYSKPNVLFYENPIIVDNLKGQIIK